MTKKVKTVTHQPLISVNTSVTSSQLLDELHYQQARQVTLKLLQKGLISSHEFHQIDQLHRQSFPPLIGPESVDISTVQS